MVNLCARKRRGKERRRQKRWIQKGEKGIGGEVTGSSKPLLSSKNLATALVKQHLLKLW